MKELLERYDRYSKYYDDTRRLAEIDLSSYPTAKEIGLSPKRIQHCYRDMKKAGFKGEVVDFLSWVSTQFIIVEWSKEAKHIEPVVALKDICKEHDKDCLNLIRLFLKRPMLIFEDELFCGSPKEIYDAINSIRFSLLFPSVKS
jgi:hypothetical protein